MWSVRRWARLYVGTSVSHNPKGTVHHPQCPHASHNNQTTTTTTAYQALTGTNTVFLQSHLSPVTVQNQADLSPEAVVLQSQKNIIAVFKQYFNVG